MTTPFICRFESGQELSAVMSINDRPPCIRYIGAALAGGGAKALGDFLYPRGISKRGGFSATTLPPRLQLGLTEAPSSCTMMYRVLDECVAVVIEGAPQPDRTTLGGMRNRLAHIILTAVSDGERDPTG